MKKIIFIAFFLFAIPVIVHGSVTYPGENYDECSAVYSNWVGGWPGSNLVPGHSTSGYSYPTCSSWGDSCPSLRTYNYNNGSQLIVTQVQTARISLINQSRYRSKSIFLEDSCLVPDDPIPSHCSNGELDWDKGETAWDCGGPCDECLTFCPAGWSLEARIIAGDDDLPPFVTGLCVDNVVDYPANELGECPSVLIKKDGDNTRCVQWTVPVEASEEFFQSGNILIPEPIENPWNQTQRITTTDVDTSSYTTEDSEVEVTKTTTETIGENGYKVLLTEEVVNAIHSSGLRTETITQTKTVSGIGGSGGVQTSKTTTREYGIGGGLVSESTQEYGWDGEGTGDPLGFGGGSPLKTKRQGVKDLDFSPITDSFEALTTERWPFSYPARFAAEMGQWVAEPQPPSFHLPLPLVEEPVNIRVPEQMEPLAAWFRGLIAFLATLLTGWLCIRTWRG